MRTATIATAVAALASSVTAYYAPTGHKGTFTLQVIAIEGNESPSYDGDFLSPYHVGAGINALVPGLSQTGSQTYNYSTSTGQITAYLGASSYGFSFEGFEGSDIFGAPKGYDYIGFNAGPGDAVNFGQQGGNYLQFPSGHAGDQFAICLADIYTEGVYQDALYFRSAGAAKNANCTDVKIKAIF